MRRMKLRRSSGRLSRNMKYDRGFNSLLNKKKRKEIGLCIKTYRRDPIFNINVRKKVKIINPLSSISTTFKITKFFYFIFKLH